MKWGQVTDIWTKSDPGRGNNSKDLGLGACRGAGRGRGGRQDQQGRQELPMWGQGKGEAPAGCTV